MYEWLLDTELDITDVKTRNYADVLDNKLQFEGPSIISRRHRVRNNLPGTKDFCPLVRKTEKLKQHINNQLDKKAKAAIGNVHPELLIRAAAFLLLQDSKASFTIEGETPANARADRWANAIGQAGAFPLSHDEFLRLQQIVISDFRFTHYGYRNEGGFVGSHSRSSGTPLPAHISARWQDVYSLMNGLLETKQLLFNSEYDAVILAAIISFGFVFIHPFEDGNGRIHRYLIHHILSVKKFTPSTIIFPISYTIMQNIADYKNVLESYSRPRLSLIDCSQLNETM